MHDIALGQLPRFAQMTSTFLLLIHHLLTLEVSCNECFGNTGVLIYSS